MEHPFYIEDYLVAIDRLSLMLPPANKDTFIRLANYDKFVVRRMAQQVGSNKLGLTAHQLTLAKTIIKTYTKQLGRFNITVGDIDQIPVKFELRVLSNKKTLKLEDGMLVLRNYSFDKALVTELTFLEKMTELVFYDDQKKAWVAYDIEQLRFRLAKLVMNYENHEIDQPILDFYFSVLNEDLEKYRIILTSDGTINNAHPRLNSAIEDYFSKAEWDSNDRLIKLIDLSPIYKYEVCKKLTNNLITNNGISSIIMEMLLSRNVFVEKIDDIVDYINLSKPYSIMYVSTDHFKTVSCPFEREITEYSEVPLSEKDRSLGFVYSTSKRFNRKTMFHYDGLDLIVSKGYQTGAEWHKNTNISMKEFMHG